MLETMQEISNWDIWTLEVYGNSVARYGQAFVIFAVLFALFLALRAVLLGRLRKVAAKSANRFDDTLVQVLEKFGWRFYLLLSIYVALQYLTLSPWVDHAAYILFVIWMVFRATQAVQIILSYFVGAQLAREAEPESKATMGVLARLASILIWIIGALLLLANLGVNVNSLIAGLGIGGLAVALAAQNILGDIFSSLAILFDKPFVPGDVIVIGEHTGVVEKIGIKTTRIRALQGEEIVVSNKELTSIRIQNFKSMRERRVIFRFGVLYETPSDLLEQIPGLLKEIVENQENARFERAHFGRFDESALGFEVVYYVLAGDYNIYMDTNQSIFFKIKRAFAERSISMAYPTRTIHLQKSE